MPLDFPSSPTNGQAYQGYIYNAANETWDSAYAPRAATIPISSPNYIINGAFDIWQRGTSFTTSVYTADRWTATISGTCTHSQESTVVPDGARYAYKWVTGASSSYGQIRQFIETATVVALRGKTVTASAYVKVSAGFTGNIGFEIYSSSTTDTVSGFSGSNISQTATTTSSTSWTRITSTFVVPTNAVGLYIGIVPSAVQASGVTVYIGNIQLEEGAVATDFRRNAPSIAGELAACQRYYYRAVARGANAPFAIGQAQTAVVSRYHFNLPVPMRALPSAIDYSGPFQENSLSLADSLYNVTGINIESNWYSDKIVYLVVNTSGQTAGRVLNLSAYNSASAYIGISSEL